MNGSGLLDKCKVIEYSEGWMDGYEFEKQLLFYRFGITDYEDLGEHVTETSYGLMNVYIDRMKVEDVELIVKSSKLEIEVCPHPGIARLNKIGNAILKLQPSRDMGGDLYAGEE